MRKIERKGKMKKFPIYGQFIVSIFHTQTTYKERMKNRVPMSLMQQLRDAFDRAFSVHYSRWNMSTTISSPLIASHKKC